MITNVIEVNHLSKSYGNVKAVDDVSFAVESGKIYGLLGRNGAGKTTIMQMITAQGFPSHGELKVFGETPYENRRVLSQICFIKESQKYPDSFRICDVLDICESFCPNWDKAFAYSLIQDFRLPSKRRIKKLSRGMRSSVGIIIGLASRAPLTIFDEPYLGLDAVARSLFYDRLLKDYAEHPRTIVLSTHLIDEVSRILEHVILIDQGRLLIDEDAEVLRGAAVNVMGQAAQVASFTAGKRVIRTESFGSQVSAMVMGDFDSAQRSQAKALGLEMTSVSLQQFVVSLTSAETLRKAASAQ